MDHSRLVLGFICVIIGMVISLAMDTCLHHIGLVLSCHRNCESLKAKVENQRTIIRQLEKHHLELNSGGNSANLAVNKWFEELNILHGDASEMVQNCIIPRVNIISCYQSSNEITKKISSIDKHLKFVPLIQSELLLWQFLKIPRLVPGMNVPLAVLHSEIRSQILDSGKTWAIDQILGHIKTVFFFNTELESLKDLTRSMGPIFSEILQIQGTRSSPDTEHEAINAWLTEMHQFLKEADEIEWVPWWNVICRYKKSKQITSLFSDIDAHVTLASLINLELIFQGTKELESLSQWEESWQESLLQDLSILCTLQTMWPLKPEELFIPLPT